MAGQVDKHSCKYSSNSSDILAIMDMARGVGRINKQPVSDRIVRTTVLCHEPSQDTHVNTCNLLCSGPGKRKLSGRKGRWWTTSSMQRRPWKSTGLARERLDHCRQVAKDTNMNDKFNDEQLHWAKEGRVAGDAVDWMQEVASCRVDQDIIIRNTSVEKPGGSAETAKDIPGKHSTNHLSNIFLPGHDADEWNTAGQGVHHQGAG